MNCCRWPNGQARVAKLLFRNGEMMRDEENETEEMTDLRIKKEIDNGKTKQRKGKITERERERRSNKESVEG